MKKNIVIIVFYSIIIPLIVFLGTGIWKDIDIVTKVFLGISLAMYIWGLILILPLNKVYSSLIVISKRYKELNQKGDASNNEKYIEISKIIEENNSELIKNLFDEFKKTLKKVKMGINEYGEETTKFYSTNDIEYYFDEDNLVYNNIQSRTFTQITQALTAVGMFGTFLGIVNGVSKLNVSGDGDVMKEGIQTLLAGVKTSFNSSLYGILFSVILTFILKIIADKIMKESNYLCKEVKKIIDPYTEQSALSDLENELKKQTSTFEVLSTNIVEEMGKKFDQSMQVNLKNLSDSVNEMIKQMQDKLSTSINENMMSTIISLTTTMQPVMEKLESSISKLEFNQETTTGKFFEESIGSIKDAINIGTSNEITRLKESMDTISEKNSELLETFNSSMENMKQLTLYQENLVKNTTNSTESINITTENIKELQEDLSKVIVNLKNVNSTSNTSLDNINSTIASMQESMKKQLEISSSLEDMVNKSNMLGELQTKYINKFEKLSTVMSNNIENTQKTMNELNSDIGLYKNYFENIKNSTIEVASTLDEKYKNITDDVERVNNNLIEVVDSIKSNILNKVNVTGDKLIEVTNGLDNFQNSAHKLMNKIEMFAEVEEATQNLWKDYKGSFEQLNNNINDGITNYTKNVSEGVNTLFTEYDTNISNAVSSLKKMIEILNESAENIAESLEALEKTNNLEEL